MRAAQSTLERAARTASRRARCTRTMASASHYPHGLKTLSGCTMASTLKRLGPRFETIPLDKSSPYIKPASIMWELDGRQRRWDVVQSMDSVGVILHHTGLDAFIIVRQFRPAVYSHKLRAAAVARKPVPGREEGFTFELCAGLIDKSGKSFEDIVVEEIAEECGFKVAPEAVRSVGSAVSSSGTSGADHFIFFAQVDESMRITDGGGLSDSGEAIEVLALPVANGPAFALDSSLAKSPGLMFGLTWAYYGLQPGGQLRGGGMETGDLALRGVGLEADALMLKSVLPS